MRVNKSRDAYLLIEALPLGSSLPSVGAEPDGHITLEWYRHPGRVLSVSVSPEGRLGSICRHLGMGPA